MPPPKRSKSVKEMIPLRDESSFDRTRKPIMLDTSPDDDFLLPLCFFGAHCRQMPCCLGHEYR